MTNRISAGELSSRKHSRVQLAVERPGFGGPAFLTISLRPTDTKNHASAPGCLYGHWFPLIEIEIQFEHIHSRLAENAKLAAFRMRIDDLSHFVLAHFAFSGDARNLKLSRRRRDVRVKSRTGSSHQVNGHRLAGIVRLELFHIGFHAVDELLVGWSKIRSGRGAGIVPGCAGGAGPRTEITRTPERLTNDSRADNCPITSFD